MPGCIIMNLPAGVVTALLRMPNASALKSLICCQVGGLAAKRPLLQSQSHPLPEDFSLKTLADVEDMQAFWRSFPSLEQSARQRPSTPATSRHPSISVESTT